MLGYLSSMPRRAKRTLMLASDAATVPLALWGAFVLRLGEPLPPLAPYWWLFLLLPLVSLPIFIAFGFYRAIVRYMGAQAVAALVKGVTLSSLLLAAMVLLAGAYAVPRSVVPLYWLLALAGLGGSRLLVRVWLQRGRGRADEPSEPVIIYGAGSAGAQLAAILGHGARRYRPVAFVDDDPGLQGSVVQGVRVYAPRQLEQLIAEQAVGHVLLALPTAAPSRRQAILRRLEPFPVHVKTVPALADVIAGKARLDDIREVAIEDLLGRDAVGPNAALMAACLAERNVLVTGAGGSIGSELCRQIVRQRPARLILFERSEYGLYRLERELASVADRAPELELVPLLGSVTDRARLSAILRRYNVHTVYHAAAYKHVPIVEHNVSEGVYNNVLGTWAAASAARAAGVRSFVLISTDKAVRPANVMGASKRLAELLLQALAADSGATTFCMVRFGNVLGSSGSVVPLFREQIRRGGPVTVTHPQITRYFMTIPEAAALVIQAGAMARGGEVFVLDMGEPVRIVDLARKLIHLMGCRVRDADHPDGDVEIRFTGLRPGEKLYEELLIGDNVTGTEHPKIYRAREDHRPLREIQALLDELQPLCEHTDCEAIKRLLQRSVAGYTATPIPPTPAPGKIAPLKPRPAPPPPRRLG